MAAVIRFWIPFVYVLCGLAVLRAETPGERWWGHVRFLADDRLEGREAVSSGFQEAAQYVAREFASAGLKPGVGKGWLQTVPMEKRQIDESSSSLALVDNGKATPITLGREAYLRDVPDAAPVEAEMIFVGHGLTVPEKAYEDLQGLDVKGKIVVYLTGTPPNWPGPLAAHVQSSSVRWAAFKKAGAIGTATIQSVQTTPWVRASAARVKPQYVARLPIDDEAGQKVQIVINPDHADLFLEGTGHTLQSLKTLAAQGMPLPKFPLRKTLKATTTLRRTPVESANVAGVLPGKTNEYVVLTAHLDHVGKTISFAGDGIFNGAMDNASGVAAVIEAARRLKQAGSMRRGVVFVALTGEESGLQGSRYFALSPTVPKKRIVANLNLDMFLPLYPFRSVTALGAEESSLRTQVAAAAQAAGVEVIPDPMPEQRRFTRSDQYSFVREGIPALAFKFGYVPGSPEETLQKQWLERRYHDVSDDLSQPLDKEAAARFVDYLTDLTQRIANDPKRPAWNADSFFRRFVR
jgi:Zn-dependent M28 family amino/carboxypeptidase